MPVGANRRHKRQDEKAGENIVGVAGFGCVVDWAVHRRSVWGRLYGCGVGRPEAGKMQGVGLASRHYRAQPCGAASFIYGKGVKEVFGSPPLPLRGLRRHSLDICQLRGSAIRQGKCFATTRFRCLSVAAHPTKKKAATLSLNVSAQNILKNLFTGVGEIIKPLKTVQIPIL